MSLQKSFWKYPNYGWYQRNEFTELLDDLHNNVEILPTKWNVTEVRGESFCTLINKSKYDETIIRHFAGGQKWRTEWFENEKPPFRAS